LLEFAKAVDLANTWLKKDDQKLAMFESVADHILVHKADRKLVRNVIVMRGEQHCSNTNCWCVHFSWVSTLGTVN